MKIKIIGCGFAGLSSALFASPFAINLLSCILINLCVTKELLSLHTIISSFFTSSVSFTIITSPAFIVGDILPVATSKNV